ncbi:hypothetical protein [Lelliottia amnigena]|uniref:hypothetical protein n=1 Tax=Lelliottia amnigena TaxID=61646 RepID=UPI004057A423
MTPEKNDSINREVISDALMSWSHDIVCCSESLWLLLERMTSEEEIREHALITLVVKTLEEVKEKINTLDSEFN